MNQAPGTNTCLDFRIIVEHVRLPTWQMSCTEQILKAFKSVKLDLTDFTAAWMHLTKLLKKRDRSHVFSTEIKGLGFSPQQETHTKGRSTLFP